MKNRKAQLILIVSFAAAVILYIVYILYANQAHAVFMQEDPALNALLYGYSDVSETAGSLFLLCVLFGGWIFTRMFEGRIFKGLAHYSAYMLALSLIAFSLEFMLKLWNRKPLASLIQFAVAMISGVVVYFLCIAYRSLKRLWLVGRKCS